MKIKEIHDRSREQRKRAENLYKAFKSTQKQKTALINKMLRNKVLEEFDDLHRILKNKIEKAESTPPISGMPREVRVLGFKIKTDGKCIYEIDARLEVTWEKYPNKYIITLSPSLFEERMTKIRLAIDKGKIDPYLTWKTNKIIIESLDETGSLYRLTQ